MATLALDLASVTGWAIHMPGMEEPAYGSLMLPKTPEEVGPPAERLRQFLRDKHKIWNFNHVVFEAQHIPQAPKRKKGEKGPSRPAMDMKSVYKLIALGGMTEWWCHQMGIKCYKVHIASWRSHFLGSGKFSSREVAKAKCMAVVQHLGWDTIDIDAAEACGILDYFLSMLPDYERPWRDRMLAGGLVS